MTELGAGAEFDRLRAIFARLREQKADGELGDDCALVRLGGTTLAASVDLSLEGVHFRTDWLSFQEIGWRAAAYPTRAVPGSAYDGLRAYRSAPAGTPGPQTRKGIR